VVHSFWTNVQESPGLAHACFVCVCVYALNGACAWEIGVDACFCVQIWLTNFLKTKNKIKQNLKYTRHSCSQVTRALKLSRNDHLHLWLPCSACALELVEELRRLFSPNKKKKGPSSQYFKQHMGVGQYTSAMWLKTPLFRNFVLVGSRPIVIL
jgi:hypothetical protein